MDLPTVVGQQTLYYIEVSLSFTYFLSLPLLKSYRKLLLIQAIQNGGYTNVAKKKKMKNMEYISVIWSRTQLDC